MRALQHQRLAKETSEERTGRLEHMKALQHQRLALESSEVRDIRSVVNSMRNGLIFFKERRVSHTFIFSLSVFILSDTITCIKKAKQSLRIV